MKINFDDKTVGGFNYELFRGLSIQNAEAAEFGECMETIGRVKNGDFESWIREWTATADGVSAFGERELTKGDKISARKAFMRASNYYRMAVFYAVHTDPRHTHLWKRGKECFHKMIGLMSRPLEEVDVEFEGAKLPGYFVSAGEGKRPTLIALGGFDSTMEEVYWWIGAAAVEYGWNCFVFEGPGQWSALKTNPGLVFRPDYEKPMSAAVDYLLSRSDVDEDRLALIGYSAGGYFAPRAAAGEPRIKACIPNTLVVDCGEAARVALKGLRNPWVLDTGFNLLTKVNAPFRWGLQHSKWTLGIKHPHEWPEAYNDFTLKGLKDRLTNPTLFLFSEDDIKNSSASSPKIVVGLLDFILSLGCERFLHLFTKRQGASSHCQIGGMTYAQAVIFQWLNHVLCGKPTTKATDPNEAMAFIDLFGKHGGKEGATKARELLQIAHLI